MPQLRHGRKVFPYEEGTERMRKPHHFMVDAVAKFFPMRRELKDNVTVVVELNATRRKVFPYEEGTESAQQVRSTCNSANVAKFFPMRRELKDELMRRPSGASARQSQSFSL